MNQDWLSWDVPRSIGWLSLTEFQALEDRSQLQQYSRDHHVGNRNSAAA